MQSQRNANRVMPGKRLLLDTNALIALAEGKSISGELDLVSRVGWHFSDQRS